MNTREAAELLQVSPNHISALVRRGEIRARKVKGGGPKGYHYEIDRRSIDALAHTNGNGSSQASDDRDPFVVAMEELVAAVRNVRRGLKAHDEAVKRKVIAEIGSSLIEGVKGG